MNVMRCGYCGKFISYAEFETGTAGTHFTPDSAFTDEDIWFYHVRCEER